MPREIVKPTLHSFFDKGLTDSLISHLHVCTSGMFKNTIYSKYIAINVLNLPHGNINSIPENEIKYINLPPQHIFKPPI